MLNLPAQYCNVARFFCGGKKKYIVILVIEKKIDHSLSFVSVYDARQGLHMSEDNMPNLYLLTDSTHKINSQQLSP